MKFSHGYTVLDLCVFVVVVVVVVVLPSRNSDVNDANTAKGPLRR